METVRVRSRRRGELIDITADLQGVVDARRRSRGPVAPHHRALTINENADPDVRHDLIAKLDRLAPQDEPFYRHAEGNSDSHLKTSFFGPSLTVIVSEGRLVLGTWQGVYFCEFDGPRERSVAVRLLSADPPADRS
jgi:secondary thiamine-phosphate synthase enzyme